MIYKWINFEGKNFFHYCAYMIDLKSFFGTSYKKSVDYILFSIQKSVETAKWTQFRVWINLCDRPWGSRRHLIKSKYIEWLIILLSFMFELMAFIFWVGQIYMILSKHLWWDVLGKQLTALNHLIPLVFFYTH